MSRRIFYDPTNPVMLTDAEIERLSPAEANAAVDQLDQNLVRVLTKIDENFAEANQVLFSRILPAVQAYGENSQQIWASVKFWKSFFEASANTKLDNPYQMGDMSFASQSTEKVPGAGGESDTSIKFQDGAGDGESDSASGTPRAAHTYSADLSPYQALQRDLQALGADASPAMHKAAVDQAARDVARLRLGLPADSPGMPPLPDFETGGMSLFETIEPDTGKGKGRADDISYGSPRPRQRAGTDKFNPDLRHQLLKKQMASPRPPSSAAAKTRLLPTDLPKGWNGIADLSQTPMSAFASPVRPRDGKSAARGVSPPPAMSYDLSHAPKYTATPSKEAARRVARDVYEFSDSPVTPPSVLKNWKGSLYDDLTRGVGPAPSPSEGLRKGFEEESYADDDEISLEIAKGTNLALADFQGGTTAKIDDLLNEDSFAHIVDDGDGRQPGGVAFDEDDSLGEGDVSVDPNALSPMGADESYLDEGTSRDVGGGGGGGLDGPEDTLFGMPQKAKGKGKQVRYAQGDADDSFEQQLNEGSRFKMHGLDDMNTFHGGDLLQSEPFEPSPLAARELGSKK